MFPTDEQARAMESLRQQYGEPEAVFHEVTDEPYGLVRMEWAWQAWQGPLTDARRILFVRPDGTRLAWRMVEP